MRVGDANVLEVARGLTAAISVFVVAFLAVLGIAGPESFEWGIAFAFWSWLLAVTLGYLAGATILVLAGKRFEIRIWRFKYVLLGVLTPVMMGLLVELRSVVKPFARHVSEPAILLSSVLLASIVTWVATALRGKRRQEPEV